MLFACAGREKVEVDDSIPQEIVEGKALFLSNCKACHDTNMLAGMTGPALGLTVFQRKKEWWVQATQNFGKLVMERDSIAMELCVKYNLTTMQNYEYLSEKEILAIYEYVKWKTKKVKPELDR